LPLLPWAAKTKSSSFKSFSSGAVEEAGSKTKRKRKRKRKREGRVGEGQWREGRGESQGGGDRRERTCPFE